MAYLLYSNRTALTGRNLRSVLGIPGGIRRPAEVVDVLVRWGSSIGVGFRPGRVVNSQAAVRLAADKLASLDRLREAMVPTPTIYRPNDVMQLPVLGRRTQHTQGKDIVLCLQRFDVRRAINAGCTHFTRLLSKTREYRVHVFGQEVIKISEKVLTDPEKYCPWIWNFETGFTFRNPHGLLQAQMQQINAVATAAVQALGLDFGAVDVVLDDDGFARVLEVNTGPSLAENSLRVYAEKLAPIVGTQINEEALQEIERRTMTDAQEPEVEEQADEEVLVEAG